MTPNAFRQQGAEMQIHYVVAQAELGLVLVAETQVGVCAIFMGDEAASLKAELEDCFARAELLAGDVAMRARVATVVATVDNPQLGRELPLDIRGTAFQRRVWQALREIPVGETRSYSQLAQELGSPLGARAVAGACAANRLAVLIPCHRVLRNDGAISGYRWGVERKRRLLNQEALLGPSTRKEKQKNSSA